MFKHEEINDEIAVFSSEYAVVIWWKQLTHSISSQKTIRKLQELYTLESQWIRWGCLYYITHGEKREKVNYSPQFVRWKRSCLQFYCIFAITLNEHELKPFQNKEDSFI